MVINVETIYYLENPEDGIIKFANGSQLKYGNIVKDIFGVADINDLLIMIEYNKSFQESICKAHGIGAHEITLDMIFRVASKNDLILNKKNDGDILLND